MFSGEASCSQIYEASDYCSIRAIDLSTGVLLHPQDELFQVFVSEDNSGNDHAYQWVAQLGEGTHRIAVQWKVFNPLTTFRLDDWSFDLQVYQALP